MSALMSPTLTERNPSERPVTKPVELTDWERDVLARHAAGNFLTYAGHAAGAGLFEREKADMERWRLLSDKLSALESEAV